MLRFIRSSLVFLPLIFILGAYGNPQDSLKQIVDFGITKNRLPALLQLAWEYRHIDTDSALVYIDTGIHLASQLSDTAAEVTGYIRKGIFLKDKGEWSLAEESFNRALVLSQAQGEELDEGRVLINLGQLHKDQGNFETATAEILKASVLFEKLEHITFLKVSLNTLASLYLSIDRPQMAIHSYEKLLEMAVLAKDTGQISDAWYNLGIAHFQKADYPQALHFLDRTLRIAEEYQDTLFLVQISNAIGSVYYKQNMFDEALGQFKNAKIYAIETAFDAELAKILNNLAAVHEARREWNAALTYYQEALELANALGNKSDVTQVFANLASVYASIGDYERALDYYKKYNQLHDSIFSSNSHEHIVEMQEKYESAKKDQSIAQLNEIKTKQKSTIEKRNLWLFGVGVITLLLFILIIIYTGRLKVQRSLAKKTEELYQQKTIQLVDENSVKTLGAYLDGETTERQRLAGELHDRLGSQLATVKIYYDHLEEQLKNSDQFEQVKKANVLLKEAYTDVREIAHDLSADALTQFGLEHSINKLCETISNSGQLSVQLISVGMSANRLPSTIERVVFRSVQELMTNIIKHAEATEVQVLLKDKKNQLTITISDNGKGYNVSQSKTNSGFGLPNISKRLSAIQGVFRMDSVLGEGTKAIIAVTYASKK